MLSEESLLEARISSRYILQIKEYDPDEISKLSLGNNYQPFEALVNVQSDYLEDSLEKIKESGIDNPNIDLLMKSIDLVNSLHPEVRRFIMDNFGQHGLELLPVYLFTNYLMKQFQTMFNQNDIQVITAKLLNFMTIKMCGSLIDIHKLNEITKSNGLIGLMSNFTTNLQTQQIPEIQAKQNQNVQSTIKNFLENVFYQFSKQIQQKFNQKYQTLEQKYIIVLQILQKIKNQNQCYQLKKYNKQQLLSLNQKIAEIQSKLEKTQYELLITKHLNSKLHEQNHDLLQSFYQMQQYIKNTETSRYLSNPYAHPSPTNHNTSFDKSKLDIMLNVCSTPKSQKSYLSLIPEVIRGSQSSNNLQSMICLSARNIKHQTQHRRLKTQDWIENTPNTSRNGSPSKKNAHTIKTKERPVIQPQKKWKT